MGWEMRGLSVWVSLDAHAGPREAQDERRWQEFVADIKALVARYSDIGADVVGGD